MRPSKLGTIHTFYHLSSALFEFPVDPVPENYRPESGRHPKAALGFWVCPTPFMVGDLGEHTYALTMKDDTRKLIYPTSNLVRFYRDFPEHVDPVEATFAFRNTLRRDYDVMFLDDGNDLNGEIIILNLDSIETFVKMK